MNFKQNFTTGLVILLPIALTFFIANFFLNLLTKPFAGFIHSIVTHFSLQNYYILFFNLQDILLFLSKILILGILFLLILLIGYIGQWFFVHYFIRLGDKIFHQIPFFNKIYKACQDVVHTLFSPRSTSFSQVVLVPFPHSKLWSIGLITRDVTLDENGNKLVSVFVPGTPNPVMGFMLMYRHDQVILSNMSVEDALKFVVSCGVIVPKTITTKNISSP
jgi:uncharacterized membrane protein